MLKWLSIFVWITSFLLCAIFALIITTWVWQRSQNTPTLTTIESLYYPVSNLPFPSLTLCNMNVVFRSSMEKNFLNKMWVAFCFSHIYRNRVFVFKSFANVHFCFDFSKEMGFNETAIRLALRHLNLLVRPTKAFNGKEANELTRAMDALNITIPMLMQQMMQPCNRLVRYCKWLNRLIPCSDLFTEVQSTYGYCCAFNYVTK